MPDWLLHVVYIVSPVSSFQYVTYTFHFYPTVHDQHSVVLGHAPAATNNTILMHNTPNHV